MERVFEDVSNAVGGAFRVVPSVADADVAQCDVYHAFAPELVDGVDNGVLKLDIVGGQGSEFFRQVIHSVHPVFDCKSLFSEEFHKLLDSRGRLREE